MRLTLGALGVLASHWRRNPLQLVALAAGLVVATALWSGVQALNAEARASYDRAASLVGQDRFDRLEPAPGARLDRALYVELRRAGWAVSPVLEGRVEIAGTRLRVIGVEPLTLPEGRLAGALAAGEVGIAEFIGPPGRMLAGGETLERLDAASGDRPVTEAGLALPPLVEAGGLAPGVLVGDIGAVASLLGAGERLSFLLIDPQAPRPDAGWREIAGAALTLDPAGGESDLERLTESFHLNLTAFGVLAFTVGLFITHAAVGLAFEQRLPSIRTLRALGVPARTVAGVMLLELVLLALGAGAVGVAAGYALAAWLMPDVAASLGGLYGAEVGEGLRLRPSVWLAGLGMSLAGTLIAAGHTAARVWGMPVLASARRQAWRAASARTLRWQVALALVLLVAAALVWALGEGLAAGFAVMAGMLVGAALLLPAGLAGVLALAARRVRGAVAEWALADARLQLPGLSLALMALLLALAANIGVGTMVESFRETFTGWLDRRLAAEIYYDPQDRAQAAEIADWARGHPDVHAVLPTLRAEAEIAGWPSEIFGRADHATYREEWPLIRAREGAWDRVAAGEAVLISEQLARRAGLALGDRLTLPAPTGAWPVTVAGIHPDYGNPKGQVFAGLAEMRARWPGADLGGHGLRVVEGGTEAVMAAMAERFDLPPRDLVDQAAVKGLSTRIFEQTFAVTAALNVLTLAVAGIALFASLATLADLRLPGLAPLWAMGLTRGLLARLEVLKTLALALLTAVLAVPLGLGVAWLLVAVVNVEAFGWRLPLHVYPDQWLRLIALTALVAVAAAALPALRLARRSPARMVKVFAEER